MDSRSWMLALIALVAPAAWTSVALADCNCAPKKCQCVSPCPPAPCQPSPYYQQQPGMGQPSDSPMGQLPMTDDLTQPDDNLPALPSPASNFASSTQFASASEGVGFRDATIGDFFGSTSRIAGPSYYETDPAQGFNIPIAGGDRRFKLTENVSPVPIDRWFVNYNHFSLPVRNVSFVGQNVDRVMLGLEKTFLEGSSSLEVRLPIVGGLDATQDVSGTGNQTDVQFGNMALTLKSILWQRGNDSLISAGLSLNLPTGQDASVIDSSLGSTILRIDNQAVHLLPFVAYYHRHSSQTWSTFIVQLDFDLNGNTFLAEESGGMDYIPVSRYQEQNFLYLDYSAGHWFYEDPCQQGFLRRAAVIGELHYSTTINDTDFATAGPSNGDVVTNPFNRIDVLNATAGLRFQLGNDYLLTAAAVAPLKSGENQLFDSEIAILLSKRY